MKHPLPIEIERTRKTKQFLFNFSNAITDIAVRIGEDDSYSRCVDAISNTYRSNNKIVTTGMGKAGKVMQKFSATLCSMGVSSCFLHPGEASHGDLGIINPLDTLFVASTSGKTREVIETINLAENLGVDCIIGLTSHIDSIIREKADIILDMGEIEEEGELKLAPTTSTIVMSAITDALALVVSEEIGISKEQFGKLHHSGYLGQLAREEIKD